MNNKSYQELIEFYNRTAEEYFSHETFIGKLNSGRKLNIKYGVDLTAPFLHLGHAVNLWMMRKLQDMGHKVIFLIGDFTTRIGDPTGKSETRPVIQKEDIEKNANEFIKQISLVLNINDLNVFEIRRNSEWYDKMSLGEFLNLLSLVTHTRLISRDMFQKRIQEQKDIYMHEMLYPILQGYDSYMLESDITIVGSDQLFNEMMGKFYQEKFGQTPQVIIATKITPGLDGKNKQSKSLNNYIALTDSPKDKFGKGMSMPDEQVIQWMEVYTDLTVSEISAFKESLKMGKNPRDVKIKLAHALVEKYHGVEEANNQQSYFEDTFSNNKFPENCDVFNFSEGDYFLIDILQKVDKSQSKSSHRRLISQGGVRVNEEKIDVPETMIHVKRANELKFKVGKKTYFKIVCK